MRLKTPVFMTFRIRNIVEQVVDYTLIVTVACGFYLAFSHNNRRIDEQEEIERRRQIEPQLNEKIEGLTKSQLEIVVGRIIDVDGKPWSVSKDNRGLFQCDKNEIVWSAINTRSINISSKRKDDNLLPYIFIINSRVFVFLFINGKLLTSKQRRVYYWR